MTEQVLKKEKLLLNADKWQVRPSSWILAVYIALMPVSTALADLFIGPSILTVIAGLYIVVSLAEIVISRKIEVNRALIPVYAYFLFTLLSSLWNVYFDADWYFGQFAITTAIVFCISVRRVSNKEIKLFTAAMYLSILIVRDRINSLLNIAIISTIPFNTYYHAALLIPVTIYNPFLLTLLILSLNHQPYFSLQILLNI